METKILLKRIDEIKHIIDNSKPISVEEVLKLKEYYKVELTFTSNAMEGNSLSRRETRALIEDGIKPEECSIKDCYEALGHAAAFDFMYSLAQDQKLEITEEIIFSLHKLFFEQIDEAHAGIYRDETTLFIDAGFTPPKAEKIPRLMGHLLRNIEMRKRDAHPVVLAAYAHRKLEEIHPFAEGNGIVARLLMNLMLINRGYFVVSIPTAIKTNYISSLRIEQRDVEPSSKPFTELIVELEFEELREYCRKYNITIKNYKDLMI